jgi:hypothetical protein
MPCLSWIDTFAKHSPKGTTKFISTIFYEFYGTIWPFTKYVLRDCGGKETALPVSQLSSNNLGSVSVLPLSCCHTSATAIFACAPLFLFSPLSRKPHGGASNIRSPLSSATAAASSAGAQLRNRRHLQLEEEEALAMGSEGSAPVVGESLALSCPPSILTNCLL